MNKIPKILYLYWDRRPMSWLQSMTVDTFIRHNPGWKVCVYVPEIIKASNNEYIPDYIGEDFFSRVENNPQVSIIKMDPKQYNIKEDLHNILKSDILRYHLLYETGGVWSDFDVLWLKPMEHLSNITSNTGLDLVICKCMEYPDKGVFHYNIGILASIPKHPFYKSLIDECDKIQKSQKKNLDHQEFGVVMWKSLFPGLNDIKNKYPDVADIKYEVFYPYSIFGMSKLYNSVDLSVIKDTTMCVHWFNGHEFSKKFVNGCPLNINCSMTEIIKIVKEEL